MLLMIFLKFEEVINMKGYQGVWYIHELELQKQIQEKLTEYLESKRSEIENETT